MDFIDKENLAHTRDTSSAAIAMRLRASRIAAGYKQKEFAAALNLKPQTYHSQETKGTPSIEVMQYLYRSHRIDFNFILHGDIAQLPGDVQDALLRVLSGGAQ